MNYQTYPLQVPKPVEVEPHTSSRSQRQTQQQVKYRCVEPRGSFQQTCDTVTKAYQSSDPKLAGTPLCKTEASCLTLYGRYRESKIVTHATPDGKGYNPVGPIENCDGRLVHSSFDNRCRYGSDTRVREIAATEGTTHLVLT